MDNSMHQSQHSQIPMSGLRLWLSALTKKCLPLDHTTIESTSMKPLAGLSKQHAKVTLPTSWLLIGARTISISDLTVVLMNSSSGLLKMVRKIHLADLTPKVLSGQLKL
jgi:hypothetical protein